MKEHFVGALVALITVTFIGWFDVRYLGRPDTEPTFNSKVKLYIFIAAWEALFFVTGVLLGLNMKG